ncbi:hypothetical protein QAD02_016303, partial [Eretmocerus hayati]
VRRIVSLLLVQCAISVITRGDHLAPLPPPPHVNGIRASNVLGGPEQHASFSFVRPGLTQTAYAFNGPSSHQAFSSSVGNPHLAHHVLPNVANALAYRNPGLGYTPVGPITSAYAAGPPPPISNAYVPHVSPYQQVFTAPPGYLQPAAAPFVDSAIPPNVQPHLFASRFAALQAPAPVEAIPGHF